MGELFRRHDHVDIDNLQQMVIGKLDRLGWLYARESTPIVRQQLVLPYNPEHAETLEELTGVSEEDILRFYTYVLNGVNEITTIHATAEILGVPFEHCDGGYTNLYPESLDFINKTSKKIAEENSGSVRKTRYSLLNYLAQYSLNPVQQKDTSGWNGVHNFLSPLHQSKIDNESLSSSATVLEQQILLHCIQTLQNNPRLVDHADYFEPRNTTMSSKLKDLLWTVKTGSYDPQTATIRNMLHEWSFSRTARSVYLGCYAGNAIVQLYQGIGFHPIVAIPLSITAGMIYWFDSKNFRLMRQKEEDTLIHEIVHKLSSSKTMNNGIIEEKLGIMRFTS